MRPPKNQLLENLYTRGNEYILAKTYDNYVGYYHSVAGKHYTGAKYNPKSIQLVPYTQNREVAAYNLSKIDPTYMRINPDVINIIKRDAFPIVRVNYKFSPTPTWRYFIKRINEVNAPILEVDNRTYNNAKVTSFYYTTNVFWGSSSVIDYNRLEKEVPGINAFLESSRFERGDIGSEG